MEDRRKWCVGFEEAARRMLDYQGTTEDLKVRLSELKEQLEPPEEAGFSVMQISQQAGNERAKSSSRPSGKERMRCTSPALRGVGHTLKRFGGAGKALSGHDAGSETTSETPEGHSATFRVWGSGSRCADFFCTKKNIFSGTPLRPLFIFFVLILLISFFDFF